MTKTTKPPTAPLRSRLAGVDAEPCRCPYCRILSERIDQSVVAGMRVRAAAIRVDLAHGLAPGDDQ
jgi:hypothetical protein